MSSNLNALILALLMMPNAGYTQDHSKTKFHLDAATIGASVAAHASAVLDAYSTRRAVTGSPTVRERNPILASVSHSTALYLALQAITIPVDWFLWKRRDHRKLTVGLVMTVTAIHCLAAAHNFSIKPYRRPLGWGTGGSIR